MRAAVLGGQTVSEASRSEGILGRE